jgi:hypothetical protein
MAVCKCVKCGGKDETVICNKMVALRGAVYLQDNFNIGVFVVAIVLCVCGLLGVFS